MILELVDRNDPILHTPTPEFDFYAAPVNPIELYQNLAETMLHHNGLGLAAPQCGLPYRFFVIKSDPVIGMFNCRIVDQSQATIVLDEGCLTYPNLFFKVRRPTAIKVRYEQPDGETKTAEYTGMTARIIQHELDHVNGVVFLDRISKLERERAFIRANKKYGTNYSHFNVNL